MRVCLQAASRNILAIATSAMYIGCTNIKNDTNVLTMLRQSLETSNTIIAIDNEESYHTLQEKLADPATASRAKYWASKAERLRTYSNGIEKYLESLMVNLDKNKSLEREKSIELYRTMLDHKKLILSLDSQIVRVFDNSLAMISRQFDSTGNSEDFYWKLFKNSTHESAISILLSIQSNLRVAENRVLDFWNSKVGVYPDFFTATNTLVGQNQTYFRPNELLEISAGVASFTISSKPEIKIRGKAIPVGANGVAVYRMRVSSKLGNHSVPVVITYLDVDGKLNTWKVNVEYTVIDCSSSSEQ